MSGKRKQASADEAETCGDRKDKFQLMVPVRLMSWPLIATLWRAQVLVFAAAVLLRLAELQNVRQVFGCGLGWSRR